MPTPPVHTREQHLPFEQLHWQHFEELCLRLIRLDQSVEHSQSYGTQGDEQDGIDIYARHRNSSLYSTYQCKNEKDFGPSKIKDAVDVFLRGQWAMQSAAFVLCTRESMAPKVRADEVEKQAKRLRRRKITFLTWDKNYLSMVLKNHPEIVDDFFDRPWVEAFCGTDAARALVTRLTAAQCNSALSAYHAFLDAKMGKVVYRGIAEDCSARRIIELPLQWVYVQPHLIAESQYLQEEEREREILNQLDDQDGDLAFKAGLEAEFSELKMRRWTQLGPRLGAGWDWRKDLSSSLNLPTPLELVSCFQANHKCAVMGPPGSGKSTLLQWLALMCAQKQLQPTQTNVLTAITDDTHLFPVFLPLAGFAQAIESNRTLSLSQFIRSHLESLGIPHLGEIYEREFAQGRCWILLDGVDEIAQVSMRANVVQAVETFLSNCSDNRVLLSSRVHNYNRVSGLPYFHLQGLDVSQISQFVQQWNFGLEITTHTGGFDFDRAMFMARSLIEQINESQTFQTLANNPLLLIAMLLLHQGNKILPQSRVEIYEAMTQTLLETWNHWRSQVRCDVGGQKLSAIQLRRVLGKVALWSRREKPRGILRRGELKRQIMAALHELQIGDDAEQTADSYLAAAVEQAGLLEERSPGVFAFWHPTFEEFLAASELAREPLRRTERLLPLRDDPYWREVILLSVGIIGVIDEDGEAASDLVRSLVQTNRSVTEALLHGALRIGVACLRENSSLPRSLAQELILELVRVSIKQPFDPLGDDFVDIVAALPNFKPNEELVTALGELAALPWTRVYAQEAIYRLLANVAPTNTQALELCREKTQVKIDVSNPNQDALPRFYAFIGVVRAEGITATNLTYLVWHNRTIFFIREVVDLLGIGSKSTGVAAELKSRHLEQIRSFVELPSITDDSTRPLLPRQGNAILEPLAASLVLLFAGYRFDELDEVIREALTPEYDYCGGVFDAAQAALIFKSEDQSRDIGLQRLALSALRRWLNHPQFYRKIYAAEAILKLVEGWEEQFGSFIETRPEFEEKIESIKKQKFFDVYKTDRHVLYQEALGCLKRCLNASDVQGRFLAAHLLLERKQLKTIQQVKLLARAIEKWILSSNEEVSHLSINSLVLCLADIEEGRAIVLQWMRGNNDWLRCTASGAMLGTEFKEEAKQHLLECMNSPHEEIRSAVGGLLSMFAILDKQPLLPEVEAGLRSCLGSPLGDASRNAAAVLYRSGLRDEEVMEHLSPYLITQEVEERYDTIRAFQNAAPDELFIEPFLELLELASPEMIETCRKVQRGRSLSNEEVNHLCRLIEPAMDEEVSIYVLRRCCLDWLRWNLEIKLSH